MPNGPIQSRKLFEVNPEKRKKRIHELFIHGLSTKAIAERMGLAPSTISEMVSEFRRNNPTLKIEKYDPGPFIPRSGGTVRKAGKKLSIVSS